MIIISTGSEIDITAGVKVKSGVNATSVVSNIAYPAGAGYLAASGTVSTGSLNVGGTQWTIPTLTSANETIALKVEITDATAFQAGTRTVTITVVTYAGEVIIANNVKEILIDNITCIDVNVCVSETIETVDTLVEDLNTLEAAVELITPTEGTYNPTLTAIANVDAVTNPQTIKFIRIGKTIIVSGVISLDTTATGVTAFNMTLPPAYPTALAGFGGVASNQLESARINDDGGLTVARFSLTSSATSASLWGFTFMYTIA